MTTPMSIALLTLIGLTLASCGHVNSNSEKLDLKYISIRRSGVLDTVYRQVVKWVKKDSSTTITYKEKWSRTEKIHDMTYRLSTNSDSDSLIEVRRLASKTFEFEGRDYLIEKYRFDMKNGDDEEMLYFYSPDFGIVIFKSSWGGNYERLFSSDDKEADRVVFYLIEMITNSDNEFFFDWCEDCR